MHIFKQTFNGKSQCKRENKDVPIWNVENYLKFWNVKHNTKRHHKTNIIFWLKGASRTRAEKQEIKRYVITVFVIMIVCVMQIAIQLKIFIDLHQQFTLTLHSSLFQALKCTICCVSFVRAFDTPFSTGWRMIICFNRYSRYLYKRVFTIRSTPSQTNHKMNYANNEFVRAPTSKRLARILQQTFINEHIFVVAPRQTFNGSGLVLIVCRSVRFYSVCSQTWKLRFSMFLVRIKERKSN